MWNTHGGLPPTLSVAFHVEQPSSGTEGTAPPLV